VAALVAMSALVFALTMITRKPAPEPRGPLEPIPPPVGERPPARAAGAWVGLPRPAGVEPAEPDGRSVIEIGAGLSLSPCTTPYAERWPDLRGTIAVEIHLGAEGVRDATVLDVTWLPSAVMACLAGEMFSAPWPRPASEETHHVPFRIALGGAVEVDTPPKVGH